MHLSLLRNKRPGTIALCWRAPLTLLGGIASSLLAQVDRYMQFIYPAGCMIHPSCVRP